MGDDRGQPALWEPTGLPPSIPPSGGRAARRAGPEGVRTDLWDIEDVAAHLRVPKQTLYTWRRTGYGPRGFRVGKHLRWRPETVAAWVRQQETGS